MRIPCAFPHAFVLIGLSLAAPARADEATDLPRLDVTASKPSIKLDTPGTVSVIAREQIDKYTCSTSPRSAPWSATSMHAAAWRPRAPTCATSVR
ncbi:MAG: hypothetical protein QM581_05715 [Pseudomonas sp.]